MNTHLNFKTIFLSVLFFVFNTLGFSQCILEADIKPGTTSSSISFMQPAGDKLFFSAWPADSSNFSLSAFEYSPSEGLTLITDNGIGLSSVMDPVEYNNSIYFTTNSAKNGSQLYRYTTDRKLEIISKGMGPLSVFKDKLIFSSNDSLFSFESSSKEISYISEKSFNYGVSERSVIVLNDTLFYIGPGNSLYCYDGYNNPMKITTLLYVRELANYRDKMFFVADDPNCGTQLFKHEYADNYSIKSCIRDEKGYLSPRSLTEYNGELYFGGVLDSKGIELWKYSDLTDEVTLVKEFSQNGDDYGNVMNLVVCKDKLFFSARNLFWNFDGQNFEKIYLEPEIEAVQPSGICVSSDDLYFTASHPLYGRELWKYAPLITSTDKQQKSYSEELKIIPNPSNGIFSIVASEEIKSVTLIDMNGVTQKFDDYQNISFNGSGLFFVKVETVNKVYTTKVMMQGDN